MNDPYEILGVPRTADKATVKRAYRKRARKAHPDREGGSHEEMAALNRAVALLEDPERRARYDAGEDPDRPAKTIEEEAREMLISAMDAVFAKNSENEDMAKALRQTLAAAIAGQSQERAKAHRAATKAKRVLKRLKGGELFRPMLEKKVADAERAARAFAHVTEALELAREMAESVGWEDPDAATRQTTTSSFWRG